MKTRILLSICMAVGFFLIGSNASAFQVSDGYGNCPNGLKWQSFPVDYYINEAGSDDFSFPQVETIINDSFDEWEKPCCSGFRARYQGTTTRTGYQSGGLVVLSWVENQWDPSWGNVNSVIGLTLMSFSPQSCSIGNAPIIFNGVRFDFTSSGSGTDLQSIATHEIGHLLGLDHSRIFEATMFRSYQGGTGSRTLHSDDISGVCFLYNRPCTCNSPNDCLEGDICQNGTCQSVPCTSNEQCQTGLECDVASGDCQVPPCQADSDCPGGFTCQNDGMCTSICPVCRDCETNSDCGQNGVCIQSGECVTFCQNGQCPGDSECFSFEGTPICVNADVNQRGVCPDDYTCMAEAVEIECRLDSDCERGERCDVPNNRCVAGDDPCELVSCSDGKICVNGTCEDDPNANPNDANNANNTNNTDSETNDESEDSNNSNPGAGQQGSDDILVIVDRGESDSSCATSPAGPSNATWFAALAFGAALIARKRRASR